jgi:hypothetical protein
VPEYCNKTNGIDVINDNDLSIEESERFSMVEFEKKSMLFNDLSDDNSVFKLL